MFNPPFSQNVKTNANTKLLNLIDEHFDKIALEKFFNRTTIKDCYRLISLYLHVTVSVEPKTVPLMEVASMACLYIKQKSKQMV